MSVSFLCITDFRNLAKVELSPCPTGINVLYGKNGSGKTSLLEAIYYLGIGKSFRSSTMSRLIRHSSEKFSLFSRLVNDADMQIPVGTERDAHGKVKLRIAEKDVSTVSELASLLPIRLINSQSHNLFESGPNFRRQYLDWGLFYQEEGFLACWRYFERVLKQRNAVLRDKRPKKELDIWSVELAQYGKELDYFRKRYVEQLAPVLVELAGELLNLSSLTLEYQSGWEMGMDYTEVLANDYFQACRYGYTPFGPHRADLELKIDGVPVKHFLSRGQQKLLICAMILAQGSMLASLANKSLIYLIDDLPAELDIVSQQKLISLLARQKTQVFMTAIEKETICNFVNKLNVAMKVFHVEHGSVGQMTE